MIGFVRDDGVELGCQSVLLGCFRLRTACDERSIVSPSAARAASSMAFASAATVTEAGVAAGVPPSAAILVVEPYFDPRTPMRSAARLAREYW
jgi:hypothetical protein